MEDPNIQFHIFPIDNIDHPEGVNICEERLQICPLCNSMVKLFFINFNEKIRMCENVDCEYPFGHEEIKFYKDSGDCLSGDDACSTKSTTAPSVALSTISSSAWADIDHMNKVYESEDSQFDAKSVNEYKDRNIKTQIDKENDEQLNKNVENLKVLTKELSEIDENKDQCINNEKWLKNLMNKQMSGMKLLRQGEMKKLKKTEVSLGTTELKIDIDPTQNSVSSITIEIVN